MKPFQSLVKRAERAWAGAGKRLEAFPGLATRLLEEFEYDWSQKRLDGELARWLLGAKELPEQVSLHNTFGQPPITLFNNGSVVVDLYLWVTCDTAIHSHGFRGAFRVLHGRSLQETYRVKGSRRIAPGVRQVDPGRPQPELLEAGDVRTILPGEAFIHRVIHLERPTVTLCVKTINEPDLFQWEVHPDGLAVQRRDLHPGLIKRIYAFEYLLGQDADRALRYLEKLVGALSVVMRLTLLDALRGGAFDLSEEAVDHVIAEIRRHHGDAEWFRRFETPAPLHLKELQVSACDGALERLASHFINRGYDLPTAAPLLARLAGRPLSRIDLQKVLNALLEIESIFGVELAPEDRAVVRDLLANPARKIPAPLQPFGQIRRMRDFLGMFA